jgi:predicted DNA-binding mobile mystery protein A
MSKITAVKQYQSIVDRAARVFGAQSVTRPSEGWIATVHKALGMSGAQLAKRMNVTRARISQAERAELSGGATLKSMQAIAEAMGCRFVYAIVPEKKVSDVIAAQAKRKATALVHQASVHMALEKQSLSEAQNAEEIERLTYDFLRTMPSDLWTDK